MKKKKNRKKEKENVRVQKEGRNGGHFVSLTSSKL